MDRLKCLLVVGALAFAGWAVAAGTAAAPASAQAPPAGHTVFVHSAPSGELGSGRLTLRGVGRRVTWVHESGRSGALLVETMHRLLFTSGRPSATGALHVAGHHGGDELTFTLTRPSYNASRGTVSYRVKQINRGHLPARAGRAAQATQQSVPRRCQSSAHRRPPRWEPPTPTTNVFPPGRLFFGGAGGP